MGINKNVRTNHLISTTSNNDILNILRNLEICWLCDGDGDLPDLDYDTNKRDTCPDCNGLGYINK